MDHEHEDVLWLRFIGNREIIYIAVVYIKPKDIENHKKILQSIRNNEDTLKLSGNVVARSG